MNITNRCTNNCYFCLRKFKIGIGGFNLKIEKEPSSIEVIGDLQNLLNRRRFREIVFCGFGEPTLRLDTLLEISSWINKYASKPVRVDTNGQALLVHPERDVVTELKKAGVSRLSVSLNAQNRIIYNEVCQPRFDRAFEKILEFIEYARDADLSVEITAVAIPEIEISKVEKIASDMQIKFRIRPYSPCIW